MTTVTSITTAKDSRFHSESSIDELIWRRTESKKLVILLLMKKFSEIGITNINHSKRSVVLMTCNGGTGGSGRDR